MHKLFWTNELDEPLSGGQFWIGFRFFIDSYLNSTNSINEEVEQLKTQIDIDEIIYRNNPNGLHQQYNYIQLINPLQTFIFCHPLYLGLEEVWNLHCLMGLAQSLNFRFSSPGEAGSQCSPRFKAEDGLCVPVDPSKNTYWGTKEGLVGDVNFMRRKYAKKYGIPNMHQLTWNESFIEILKPLNVDKTFISLDVGTYPASNDSSWDGVWKNWRITELSSFSAVVAAIDEAVYKKLFIPKAPWEIKKMLIRGKEEEPISLEEMIHPLQTSIGCMKKEQNEYGHQTYHRAICLLGNVGQWPSDWKLDVNSKKIPGSECMDGYVNDDGLCSIPLPTTTPEPVPNTPKNPNASDEKKNKEGDAGKETAEEEGSLESSSVTTRIYSYGLWILVIICLLF